MDKGVKVLIVAELAISRARRRAIEEEVADPVPAVPLQGLVLYRRQRGGSHPRLNGIARGVVGIVGPDVAEHLYAVCLGLLDRGQVGCILREPGPAAGSVIAL